MPATFELKSANLPLLALRLTTADLQALQTEWAQQYAELPDFFDQEPLVIDLDSAPEVSTVPNLSTLVTWLRRQRVQPLAYRGGSPRWVQAAQTAGLVAAPDAAVLRLPPEPVPPPPPQRPLVLDKPLRSGQRYYAKGRDLVVLAPVSSGAEVISDGNLYLQAPMRGRAAAGASGDSEAVIFITKLEAELLSIAGHYRTADQLKDYPGWGQACQVRLHTEGEHPRMLVEKTG